jgi:hypothetical protein
MGWVVVPRSLPAKVATDKKEEQDGRHPQRAGQAMGQPLASGINNGRTHPDNGTSQKAGSTGVGVPSGSCYSGGNRGAGVQVRVQR